MNLKTATAVLAAYIAADVPAFLWGPPGVGKSAIVRDVAKERGWKVIDFRCSTRDPVALMGLPDLAGETTRWKVPDEFPQVERDGEFGILFLDELNVAAPSMQAAAFGLVLDRRVGEYTLPPAGASSPLGIGRATRRRRSACRRRWRTGSLTSTSRRMLTPSSNGRTSTICTR